VTEVDDCTLYFVHAKGIGPRPFPLLFTHGWPGSFWEVHKIIGPLTDPAAHGGDPAGAFDVVAPSLPGYGFSPHPGRPGLGPKAIADLLNSLMVEGGDWGAVITTCLGRDHGGTVAGIHLNMIAAMPVLDEHSAPLSRAEQEFVDNQRWWRTEEGGYGHIQGTKPSTLAAGLADSPAGLAAWIEEKFRSWTNTIGTSARLYYESQHDPANSPVQPCYIDTPTGFARFPKEIWAPPREWVERAHNLVRFTEFERGGHFAASEQPEALVEEIRAFFRPLRG
jgi:pimeloyl-ACP methyl ester carboxylesterase